MNVRRGMWQYVPGLLARMCEAPSAVQPLFASTVPARQEAVPIAFERCHDTSPQAGARDGAWWTSEWLGVLPAEECGR